LFLKFLNKIRKRKKWKELNNFLPFFAIFGLLLILETGYFLTRNELSHRLPFGVKIANTEFSLVEAESAEAEIRILAENFLQQPIRFEFVGETLEILPTEIDLDFEIEKKIGLLKNQLVNLGEVELPVLLNEKRLRKLLLARFPELEYGATNAKVFLNDARELEILEEKSGHKTDFEEITAQVKKNLGGFSDLVINISITEILPQVFAKNLEPFREELLEIIAENLVLKKTAYERFEINLAERIAWFDFKKNGKLRVFLREDALERFAEKELSTLVADLAHDVTISQDFNGEIKFEGVAKSGQIIDTDELFTRISAALESDEREVEIPFRVLPAPVKVTDELRKLGIHELVGEAITTYDGSPANRQHNIRIAAAKLNGVLIPDGEEFSFNQNLGFINTRNGYRKELIIREGDVTPEIGGGVCQVSTTFFRTALDAGLPITRRKPHSLKVHYYQPPGLDATIYPGQSDFRFSNDTGHPILVQTAVEGTQLRVNFFGTNDGRSVRLAGPFYPNGDVITNLKNAGMKMFWTREVERAEGEKIEERYNAAYSYMPIH
jgi:vancomycin resistance protein YoaR